MTDHDDTNKKCVVLCSAMNIYLGLSVGLSCYNKYILNLHKFPLFLLTCQFFFLFIICGVLIYTLLKPKLSKTPFWVTKISLSTYIKKLLPIGFLYGGDFILTNIAIANGPLAFVQMVKSGVPLIVLFFKLMDGDSQQIMNSTVILSMILLMCGQLLIYIHEVEFDWLCFTASVAALLVAGVKLNVIEKLLKHRKSAPTTPTAWDKNDIKSKEDDDTEETSAFIGMDSFSPAELMLTDSEDGEPSSSYFYDVDVGRDTNTYKENVELQIVETNKRHRVRVISNPQNGKIKHNVFESILNKLSAAHSEAENDSDSGINLIKKEQRKVLTLTEDIPLNDEQKEEQKRSRNEAISSTKHRKQKMHSMLAIFYFMPISWLTAITAFICFEYPQIKTESVFTESTEMVSLLFEYLLSAIIAVALNWCELFMIGRWNALSFCIFGVFKLICIVGASWLFFAHAFTMYSACGYCLCIVGVMVYNWSQIKDKSRVQKDMKQIYKACAKSMNRIECFKRNKRRLYTKIWSEFPQHDGNEERRSMYDYDSQSSSD
eukprot:304810_1